MIGTSLTSIVISDDEFDAYVAWQVQLKDENSNNLGSKTVKLYIDNVFKKSGTTNSTGRATLADSTTFGTHTVKVVFEGDDTYDGCEISRTVTF